MSKHTPGPWEEFEWDRGHVFASGRLIANCMGFSDGSEQSRNENEANARLIAAAPELLEALEQASYWLNEEAAQGPYTEPVEILRVLDAAIAKAKGED